MWLALLILVVGVRGLVLPLHLVKYSRYSPLWFHLLSVYLLHRLVWRTLLLRFGGSNGSLGGLRLLPGMVYRPVIGVRVA